MKKRILVIAGPNGAGKTTFAKEFLPREAQTHKFINADEIAASLTLGEDRNPAIAAGRLMLREIEECAARSESFAIESTLSGRALLPHIRRWRQHGFSVTIFFLKLVSVELALIRVAERVRQGGHDVAEEAIRRRFEAGWNNFVTLYRHEVDSWVVYDNSGESPILLDWSEQK